MQYSASNPVRTEYHLSALCHGDYGVVVLWFVVVCRFVIWRVRQKKSENFFDVGIIAVKTSRAGPASTVLSFQLYVHLRALCELYSRKLAEFFGFNCGI
jgi:hypothetical protein